MADINSDMSPIKIGIFNEVRKQQEKCAAMDDRELNNLLFRYPDGLRLTLAGFIAVKSIFTAYSFGIPKTMKTRHHFGLSKMSYPYFLTERRLVLFSEMDAMVVKIHGSIEGFLEIYSHAD